MKRAIDLYSKINNAKYRELFYLGHIYYKRGRKSEAEDFFINASKDSEKYYGYQTKPVFSEGFFLYGEFLIQQKRYSEAEQKFRYIIKRDYGCHLGF